MTEAAQIISLTQSMLDKGKAQAEDAGFRWDNRHPTYREIHAAFEVSDLAGLQRIHFENFC